MALSINSPNVTDCYAVLGVPRDATADQIRSRWREIRARYHPDQYQGLPEVVAMVANDKLRQIDAAADVLLDTAKRAAHDESLRKGEQRSARAGSLDFSHVESGKESSDLDDVRRSRRLAVPVLIIIAITVIVALVMMKRPSKELATAQPSAKAKSPTSQSRPASKPSQASKPSPKVQTPPPTVYDPLPPHLQTAPSQADTPPPPATNSQSVRARAIPAEFLKAFQEYAAKSGAKAIALALDNNGRWAYGSISGYYTQSGANAEALSDCTRFKAQAGVQENCRLYAVGDKMVW